MCHIDSTRAKIAGAWEKTKCMHIAHPHMIMTHPGLKHCIRDTRTKVPKNN